MSALNPFSKKKKSLLWILGLFCCLAPLKWTKAQYFDFGFSHDTFPIVKDSLNQTLSFPWAGGLHGPQFSLLDLDLDGKKDLVIFDKNGNRVLTFINQGGQGQINYRWEPKYSRYFPPMHDWMQMHDINCDGKPDIFTYGNGGVRIFMNVSDTIPKFKLRTDQLLSYYYNGYTNLFTLSADYPAIADIDNDGDLDILNFWVMGKYVNYHKNWSQEHFGNCDSLDFKLHSSCWGNFSENESSNVLTLFDTTCGSNKIPAEKHSGSTLLVFDVDGNQVKDLVVGDVDYSNLILLHNGGTTDSCFMVTQDTLFPSNTVPVNLPSFPVAMLLDINNDGKDDLLVSPFDPSFEKSKSTHSVWEYLNTGTQNVPVFSWQQDDFLQNQMIDVGVGAYPVLYDWNHDGLLDLFIANYGELDSVWTANGYFNARQTSSIALYQNIGTAQLPSFKLITHNYANLLNLKQKALYPAFADVDGDGSVDMLLGRDSGDFIFFKNMASSGNTPQYANPIAHYQNLTAGAYSTPQFIDLNGDGKIDLIAGNQKGTISYFQNTGSLTTPVFTHVTDSLGKVNVRDPGLSYYGYSVPCMFQHNNSKVLFCGSECGTIYYFKDISAVNGAVFTPSDTMFYVADSSIHRIYEGFRAGVAVADLNQDGFADLLVGNFAGGVSYYSGRTPPPTWMNLDQEPLVSKLNVFPNPADQYVILDPGNENTAWFYMFDITGRLMLKQEIKGKTEIQLSEIISGIYVGKIMYTQQNTTEKDRFKLLILHSSAGK